MDSNERGWGTGIGHKCGGEIQCFIESRDEKRATYAYRCSGCDFKGLWRAFAIMMRGENEPRRESFKKNKSYKRY